MTAFVVGWNSHIDVFRRGVRVAKSNDRDIDVGGFFDSLSIGTRIGNDDKARFFEGAGDVVGEVTRRETSSNGNSTGMSGKLEDSTLTVWAGRNDGNIGGVVNCCDNSSCEDDFLPVITI